MNPSIRGAALLEIWIKGSAELTIAPGRLFTALRLAMIIIHAEILAEVEVKAGTVYARTGAAANPQFRLLRFF